MKAPDQEYCNACYREGKAVPAIFNPPQFAYLTPDRQFTIGIQVSPFDNHDSGLDEYGRRRSIGVVQGNSATFCKEHWRKAAEAFLALLDDTPVFELGGGVSMGKDSAPSEGDESTISLACRQGYHATNNTGDYCCGWADCNIDDAREEKREVKCGCECHG